MASKDTILRGISLLTSAYPNFDLPKATIQVYIKLLEEIPEELFEAAVLRSIKIYKFFPSFAEIRIAAIDELKRMENIPSTKEAWLEVNSNISNHHKFAKPEFSHKLVSQTIDSLGWIYICNHPDREKLRWQFEKVYAEKVSEYIEHQFSSPTQVTGFKTRAELPCPDN